MVLMKKLKNLKNRLINLNKKEKDFLVSLAISVSITFVSIFILNLSPWEYVLGLILIFIFIYTAVSAFIIIESIFYAGAQISLALFIGDMFCKVPNRTQEANDAFLLLGTFTVIYILFRLIKRLIKNIKKVHTEYLLEDKKTQPKFYRLNIFIFGITLLTISFTVYQVFISIISNMCLY